MLKKGKVKKLFGKTEEKNQNMVVMFKVVITQTKNKTKNTTQLVKSEEVSRWSGQKIEMWKNQIEGWAQNMW